MNRVEMRKFLHKLKKVKGLQKKKNKGAFGRPPKYIMEDRKKKALKKVYDKGVSVETKEVTKSDTQPVVNKEVKEKVNE